MTDKCQHPITRTRTCGRENVVRDNDTGDERCEGHAHFLRNPERIAR